MKPKSRLKRNADRKMSDDDDKALVKKEIEVRERQKHTETMQIDTTKKRSGVVKQRDYYQGDSQGIERHYENADKLRQAHEIFGDDDDRLELPTVNEGAASTAAPHESSNLPLETLFDADEIDDPFSTKFDKDIEKKDICERLQVRLKDRMKPSDDEIQTEAEWIFDRLTTYTTLKIDHEN